MRKQAKIQVGAESNPNANRGRNAACFAECSTDTPAALATKLTATLEILVQSDAQMKGLKKILVERKYADSGADIKRSTLLNYIYFSLLSNVHYGAVIITSQGLTRSSPASLSSSSSIIQPRSPFDVNLTGPACAEAGVTKAEKGCAKMLSILFVPISNRVFINALYGRQEATRTKMRNTLIAFANAIIAQYSGTIENLTWMTAATKQKANAKLRGLTKNILYDELSFNDAQLDAIYTPLFTKLAAAANYYEQLMIVQHFWQTNLLLQLLQPTDRNVLGDTTQANAYYNPLANSINMASKKLARPPLATFRHCLFSACVAYAAHFLRCQLASGNELWSNRQRGCTRGLTPYFWFFATKFN